jgi:hypothetical protein
MAVAVHKPMHIDADAAPAAMSLARKTAAVAGVRSACSPRTVVPRASGTHGAAAHRSDTAWTRPRTDASRPGISTTPGGGAAPGSWKQLRGRRYRLRRGPAASRRRRAWLHSSAGGTRGDDCFSCHAGFPPAIAWRQLERPRRPRQGFLLLGNPASKSDDHNARAGCATCTVSTAGQSRLRDMSGKRGQLGASTNLSKSPERHARDRARRKRQEKRWARKSGPVTSWFVCPICGGPHSRTEHPDS